MSKQWTLWGLEEIKHAIEEAWRRNRDNPDVDHALIIANAGVKELIAELSPE